MNAAYSTHDRPQQSHRLLIQESPLQVLPSLAVAIGLHEAIVLQQVQYWLSTSTHVYAGRTWVYNTVESWQTQFPYMSDRTLRRTLDTLRDRGLLLTANFNTHKFDRTLWYSIDYDALERASGTVNTPSGQNGQMDRPEWTNGAPDAITPSGQADHSHLVKMTGSCGQDDQMLIEQRLHPETTQETTTPTTPPRGAIMGYVGIRGGGGGELMENDGGYDDGDTSDDPDGAEADTANLKADLVDALVALGVRPEMADRAVNAGTVTSDRDVILCKRFLLASTANVPPAVLWSQYLSLGKLPPAPLSESPPVESAVLEAARKYREESERAAAIPDECVGAAGLLAALHAGTLRTMDQPAKKRVFQWAQQ